MLPKNLKYGTKIESSLARSYRTNLQPQNGTGPYNLGDTIILNLSTRNNLVMVPNESYLKFKVTITSGAASNAFRWDSAGAHGIIQRIRIFHGSNLISDVDNYNLLAKMLFDIQVPSDATYGKFNAISGTRGDLSVALPTVSSTFNNSELTGIKLPVYQANSGERIGGNNSNVTDSGSSVSETYCINLISLVGSLCSQSYIPLFGMTSAPLRVEIQLVDTANKALAINGTVTSIQLSNVEYVANFIELGDGAMGMIYDSLQGQPLQLCFPDYRNYQYSYSLTQNVQTSITFPIPAKFSSLKAIFVTIRDKGTGATTFFPCSSVTQGISSYQFRIGSQIMPSKPPSTLQEMFCEVLKAIGSISDLHHTPSIDKISYQLASSVANVDSTTNVSSVNSGSFYVGLDLENYSSADKSSLFSGYNSNTDDIYFVGDFLNTSNAVTTRFDAFANFDVVLVCENGTCYVKF